MELNVGDILQGEIIDFTHEGNGVLKIDNFAFFIPNGIIGDIVQFKITRLKKNYGIGVIINLVKPSEDRVDNINTESGEIPLINYKYEKQLEWKKEKVKTDLHKFAGLNNIDIHDTIGMDNPYRYRNHIQIPVGIKDGKAVLGFYKKGSHQIVDMDTSILQSKIADEIILIIREWTDKYDIKVIRHIGIRTNYKDQAMVIIVTSTDYLPKSKELINELVGKIDNVVSIYHNINKLKSAPTYGKTYIKLFGQDRLIDKIGELNFYISPNSFFQVNRIQAEILYNKAIEYLDLKEDDVVFDIYCGIGTISLFIANKAKKAYGIESVNSAVNDAKENAILNKISNVEYIKGKAEEVFPAMMNKGIKGNKIVVDPPRKGCEKEVLEAIVDLNPERVVYVSCNSTTMARDVKYLIDNGYQVKEVQPVDLFGHTVHCEVVVKLEKQ